MGDEGQKVSTFFYGKHKAINEERLFGKFHLEKDFLLVNHILLLAKYFIYKCKLSKVIPSLLVFKAKLKATYTVELYIAKEKGILPNHYKKWDNFLSWLS